MSKSAGGGFIKVTGILMIIGGVLAVIIGIIAVLAVMALAAVAVAAATDSADAVIGLLFIASALTIIGGIVQLVAGIIGVINAHNPEKAKICIGWGIAVIVISLASTIFSVMGGGEFNIFSSLLGLVVPGLYIYGAIQNKNSIQ